MKTDGLFTTHAHTVQVKSGEPLNLVFFGDIHRDSPNFADGEWQASLERMKSHKNALFLGCGDYLDSTSSSERACLGKISDTLHETLAADISQLQAAKVKMLAKELSFMRGRLVGLINGNHYFQFQDGTNSDMKLCGELGCKYLGVASFIRLTFDMHGRRIALDIFAHHGAGAARLPGGSVNRVEQLREFVEADVLVMGHDHKRGAWPATPRLHLTHTRMGLAVKSRQQWLVRSGAFLKSYEAGQKSYNVDAARGSTSLGHVELSITLHKKDGKQPPDVEIHSWS